MERASLLSRIQIDAGVCGGKPCVKGTRLWVTLVLDLLAGGMSMEDVVREYPQLVAEDVRACIAYAAEMSRERFIDVQRGTACA